MTMEIFPPMRPGSGLQQVRCNFAQTARKLKMQQPFGVERKARKLPTVLLPTRKS